MKSVRSLGKGFVILLALGFVVGCSDDEDNGDGESATHTVTEEGGLVESDDGAVALEFPEGAVSEDAELTITEESSDRDDLHTGLYSFDLDGTLQERVTLSIELDDEPEGADMRLANLDGDQPMPVPGSTVEDGAVVGDLMGFSSYGGFDVSDGPFGDADYESVTTIGGGGGVATSSDGKFSIDFPAGAFDEEAEVTIINLTEQMAEQGQSDEDELDTDAYAVLASVGFDTVDELDTPATVEISVDASEGESGRLAGEDVPLGDVPGSELQGDAIVGEVTSLSYYYGALVELSERCDELDSHGDPCSDDGEDCEQGNGPLTCVCNDGEAMVGGYCHVDTCIGVWRQCDGIGRSYDGVCEDYGGWAGDCYYE